MQKGVAMGREEGELIALRSTLVRPLDRRFGKVTASVRARVEQASLDEAERWIDRVLDARTIQDIFAEQ
jgi:hypothetical protein